MKHRTGLLALGLVTIGLLGQAALAMAAKSQAPREDQANRRLGYLDTVDAPPTLKPKQAFVVHLQGNLPDPSWACAEPEVMTGDGVVTVRPWLRRVTTEPVMQVLVPFKLDVKVPGLAPGRWVLEVQSFGGSVSTRSIEVKP
ncbi:MAG: hypothetical protein VKP62_08020 [Candidatus Sericytochromatia bacterium]|nr:hypothetical protein [Candidatus Sericytochromatia bacterium]